MDDLNQRLIEVFFDVQRGLPRQGPGDNESTLKALEICKGLPTDPTVLDIGCGPGMQTMALASALRGPIVTVDTCEEYLAELRERAVQAAVSDRITVQHGDMAALDFADESFDLIWCEGAAYNIGIRAALKSWRRLLQPHGYLAFTELVWLSNSPPKDAALFFEEEYPAMTTVAALRNLIRDCDYLLAGDFTLPDSAWWDDYYTPLREKLPSLRSKYANDEAALDIVEMTAAEIGVRSRYADSYGYQFFITQKSP